MAGFLSRHKLAAVFLLAVCVAGGVAWTDGFPRLSDEPLPDAAQTAVTEPEDKKEDWRLLLVSFEHPLTEDFQVPLAYFRDSGYRVDYRIVEDLGEMFDAAAADGVYLRICSAYRSVKTQKILYDRKVSEYCAYGYSFEEASMYASNWVGFPGKSEHHTGLALDIVSTRYAQLNDSFAYSDAYQWMLVHAADYGFILRYPSNTKGITNIHFEPWHWRYVGREHAARIRESELTLEEYVEQLQTDAVQHS